MNPAELETSQMLNEHPIINERDNYKNKYINALEYFVNYFSKDDLWAEQTLHLYKKKLLGNDCSYIYNSIDKRKLKPVIATKFRPFKFFSYRYCLIIDILFLCAYGKKVKGKTIVDHLSYMYPKRYRKKIHQLYEALYDPSVSIKKTDMAQYLKKYWDINQSFIKNKPIKVMVTANMSAGKSTLINAIIGKKVNKTQNDACTAKLHFIVNKPYEDGYSYKYDSNLELDSDELSLMTDNSDTTNNEIVVGTAFRSINTNAERIWLIDTPGVNSSQDIAHRDITLKAICNTHYNCLIYLLNGENIGTDDDRKHLLFISEHFYGKILFVVNKLDKFRIKEDSIKETLDTVIADLKSIGFENPYVIPISAYAAFLSKKVIFSDDLDEDEQDEFERMVRKMNKPEYHLDKFYPIDVQNNVKINNDDEKHQLLLHSGLLHLESIIYNMR